MVLILKVAHPELINQFRPISLCNTLYKLLSRIIVQRLKPFMAKAINPCQAGFVSGRCTSDNIIIVQEAIRTLISRRGRTGYVALKLDLEKAYDRLEWPFIKETLEFFQVPSTLIALIMNMISSTRFHILWNGSPLPELVPSRGIRQGDPLSPYLFILCLERLSIKLTEVFRNKSIHPLNFRTGVHLSHLFFVDDIFLFTRATARDYMNLNQLLLEFCKMSNQIMNATKSKTWFSPRTSRCIKEQMARILGLPTTDRIGTYLGIPIFSTHRIASSCQYLVDNICKCIEGWQARYLSMADRATFIKASVTSVPIYAMQTVILPQKICHHIDKLSCHFLWGDTDRRRGCHIVNWETVTFPKKAGGLGIALTRHRNHAILMNQAWHLYSTPSSF